MNKIVTCVSLVLVSWVVAAPEAAAQAAFSVAGTGCPGNGPSTCTPVQVGQPYLFTTGTFPGNIVQLGFLSVGPLTPLPAVPFGFMCVPGCIWAGLPWWVVQGAPAVTVAGVIPNDPLLVGYTFRVQTSGLFVGAQCWQLSTACQYTILP